MKKITYLSLAVLFFSSMWWMACKKEPTAENTLLNTDAIAGEREEDHTYTDAEVQEIKATMDETKELKSKIDDVLSGQNVEMSMRPDKAAESVEMVFNQYLSRPGLSFKDEKTTIDSIKVDAPLGTNWNATQIAKLYKDVREVLIQQFQQMDGASDKTYRFIDMGTPVQTPQGVKLYLTTSIGWNVSTTPHPLPNLLQIRWAEQTGFPNVASIGFTATTCTGIANREIGLAVNSNLGFYLQNLAPAPINPSNPNSNPNVIILGPIRHVQTNYFGTNFPLGNSPAPLFSVGTFTGTSTYAPNPTFAASFLVNPTSGGNGAPTYAVRGQYKIHGDAAFSPGLPDENCFSLTKLGNYILSNRQVGDFYVPQVNQLLTGSTTPPFFQRRRLISTYVQSADGVATTGFPPPNNLALRQEHPTYHFYARTLSVIVVASEVQVCCPQAL